MLLLGTVVLPCLCSLWTRRLYVGGVARVEMRGATGRDRFSELEGPYWQHRTERSNDSLVDWQELRASASDCAEDEAKPRINAKKFNLDIMITVPPFLSGNPDYKLAFLVFSCSVER